MILIISNQHDKTTNVVIDELNPNYTFKTILLSLVIF